MLQIDPLNSSCSQEQQYHQKNIKAKSTLKEQLFGVSSCSESHTYQASVFNCSSKIFTILNE